ncbi:MAG: hypothetical protein QGH40_07330, partial [bacterium]|nr:hypothetical protein [bacterium]
IDIEKSGKFRMYVENSFETPIEMVELIVKSEAFGITIEPSTIALLIPGERSYFTVMLDLIEGKDSGEYPLKISVNAHRAEIMPSTEDIQVTVGESQSGLDGTYSSEDAESGTRLTSISEEEVGEIVIRVDDFVAKERTSIYLFPIVLLAVFFIWRRWTQK